MSDIISSNEDGISKIVSNFQTQSLKREIELLDEKLHILDSESQAKINNLSAQLALEKETEIKLRNQLSTKDKAISELNDVIKDYLSELINLKKCLSLKEEKLQEMMTQFNSIKANCNTISAALNSKEENQKKSEIELKKALSDKMKIESKIKELIGLVNEYMKQLDELNEKCSNLEREKSNLKLEIENLTEDNKKLYNANVEYSNELKNIKETIDKCEEMSNKYGEQNNELKNENDNLNNQIIENKQRIDSLLEENNKLNLLVNDYKLKKSKLENDLTMSIKNQKQANNKHENEIQEIISYCNDNIESISNWIDANFNLNNSNEKNFNNNQIASNLSFISGQYNINFELIKNKLYSAQENLINEINLMQKYQEDNTNLNLTEKGKYLTDIKKIYNNIILDVQNHAYFKCDYQLNNVNESDEIIQFLNLLDTVINNVLKYLSSINDEKNLMIDEIEKYKTDINNLQLLNNKLTQENNDFRVKLYNNDYTLLKEDMNNLKENYDKCCQMNQILEKKIKNYETEFELKQMQINSLEEMVKRRSNLTNNLTNNVTENNSEDYKPGFYNNNNSYNSTSMNDANKTIQKLSQDREKLIQDNMKLIQYNKKLKEQINSLNQIINDLSENNNNNNHNENNNENIDEIINEEQENNE